MALLQALPTIDLFSDNSRSFKRDLITMFLTDTFSEERYLRKKQRFLEEGGSEEEGSCYLGCLRDFMPILKDLFLSGQAIDGKFIKQIEARCSLKGLDSDDFGSIVNFLGKCKRESIIIIQDEQRRGYCRCCRTDNAALATVILPNGKKVESLNCSLCVLASGLVQSRILVSVGFVSKPYTFYQWVVRL